MMVFFHMTVIYSLIFFWANIHTCATMVIPPSFSAAHKTTYLQENSPIESVIKVLSSFEIDSHIEVVLIGDTFTSAMVGELTSSLQVLSNVAVAASPLKFVHEKLVYHISIGYGLEEKIRQKIAGSYNNLISPNVLGELLSEFHTHGATSTTFFVLHSGSLNSHTYLGKLPTCPQRAFLSKEGFALLDLSAHAFNIRNTGESHDHITSETEFPFLDSVKGISNNAMHTSLHDLATLIHRSGEAMVPFPIFSSDVALMGDGSASSGRKSLDIIEKEQHEYVHYVEEAAPVEDVNAIDILVFTLCMASAECRDDRDTKHAIENLLQEFSGETHNVNLVSFHISGIYQVSKCYFLHIL